MTDDKHAKRAARDLAAREGISYTAARRRLEFGAVNQEHQERPPVAVPIASTPSPEGCDGSGHPGTVCWAWRPADAKDGASWEVRRAAELPGGRAEQLAERVERPRKATHGAPGGRPSIRGRTDGCLPWSTRCSRASGPSCCRTGRSCGPPSRRTTWRRWTRSWSRWTARPPGLTTKVPAVWWGEVKPALDAYADAVESDDRDLMTESWREVEERHVVGRLVDRWRKAWVPVQKSNGYWDPPGVMWLAVKDWLDSRLVDQHGGHAPGARVRFGDGRPAVVYAVEWGEDGPPVAYRVRELEPGQHGNVGRLVPVHDE